MTIFDSLKGMYDRLRGQKGWNDLYSTLVGGDGESRLRGGNARQFVQAYESWVYACVSKNAQSVAKIPLGLFKYVKNGEKWTSEEVTDHPFLDLMRNVNPQMNEYELKEMTQTWLDITGNAYWYLVANRRGEPLEIWVLPSHQIKPITQNGAIAYYEMYKEDGGTQRFSTDEIIHFRYPNPFNPLVGLSPIQAAAYSVESNQYQKQYELAIFRNQATPSGILSTEKAVTKENLDKIRDIWNARYQGMKNAGKTAVLDNGLKYQAIAMNPKDLDFILGREMTREEICAIFGVPLGKLGIVKDVNRANGEALDALYLAETIEPRTIRIQEKLTERLAPIWDANLHVMFKNVVPKDKEFLLKERETNIRAGVTSINEERAKINLEPLDGADLPLVPIGLIPLGESFDFGIDPATGKAVQTPKIKTPALPPAEPQDEAEKARRQKEADEAEKTAQKGKSARLWHQFLAAIQASEKGMDRTMRSFFKAQQEKVMANLRNAKRFELKKSIVDSILFPLGEEDDRLKELMGPFIKDALEAGALLGATQMGIDEVSFDALNPNIFASMQKKLVKITRVNQTTFNELRRQMIDGISEGESVDQLADRIQRLYGFSQASRAPMIARTEAVGATNSGEILMYKQAGVTKKRWLSAQDERTRASHLDADGQVVGIDETFTLSGTEGIAELKHPGDPDGPAGEVINCRCTLIPVFDDNA